MTYRIITTTDAYHASRALGFKLNNDHSQAHRLDAHSLTFEEARKELERLAETARECRGLDVENEDSFISDIYTTRIEVEDKNFDTLVTPDDFTEEEVRAKLRDLMTAGLAVYNEDGERIEDAEDVFTAWDCDEEVLIEVGQYSSLYSRADFVEAALIHKMLR